MNEDKNQKGFIQKPIRTYESDIAEALGKGASVASVVIAEKKRQEESMTKEEKESKELDKIEEAAIKAKDGLQKEIEGISGKPVPPPVHEKPVLPINPAPDIVKSSPIINPVPNVERGVFTGIEQQIPIPVPPPIPKPIPKPVPPPQPTPPIQKPIPASIPIPKIEPKAVIKRVESEDIDTESKPSKNIIKPLLKTLLIIIFIGGGIFGIYYLYNKSEISKSEPMIEQKISVPSIINPDKQMSWNIGQISKKQFSKQIYSELNKNIQNQGKILEIILIEKINSEIDNGEEQIDNVINASSFIERAGIIIPDVLKRSLTDRWMFGIYTEEDESITPFIIFTTDFFQNTFAGMLSWEKSMVDDMADILNYKEKARKEGSTASSSISSYFSIRGNFIDRQIMNRDIREFRNPDGELIFLYSFINKNNLLITNTESAFIEIIKRIEKQTYIR